MFKISGFTISGFNPIFNRRNNLQSIHGKIIIISGFIYMKKKKIAANLAGVPTSTVNALSTSYVISRVIYNYLYINNESPKIANLRSFVWIASMGISFSLYILAARKSSHK